MVRSGYHSVFGRQQVAVTSWPCSTLSGHATILKNADTYHSIVMLATLTTITISTTSMIQRRSPIWIRLEAKWGQRYQWTERFGFQILRKTSSKLLDKILRTLVGMRLLFRCSLSTVYKVSSLVSCGTSLGHTARHLSTAPTQRTRPAGYSRTRTRKKNGLHSNQLSLPDPTVW